METQLKERFSINDLESNLKNMTDDEWQVKFNFLKLYIKPVQEKKLTRKARNSYIIGRRWYLSGYNDGVDTQDKMYCNYINDILKQIREKRGNPDYCYHAYHICDLLKFEPLLNTRLIHNSSTYFEVWLDK